MKNNIKSDHPNQMWRKSTAILIGDTPISRVQSAIAFVLLVLTIIGFPFAALLETFAGTGSQSVTIPYRVLIAVLSIAVLGLMAFTRMRGKLDPWLCLFMALYLLRLIYDYQTNYINGNMFAIQFYLGIVVLPMLAIALGGVSRFEDETLARWIMAGGLVISLMAAFGQSFGLAYNPWEQYGTTQARLGFEALNPISLGHIVGSAILAAIVIISRNRQNAFWRIGGIVTIITGSILLIQAGSRGAIVAIAIAILWFSLTKVKRLIVVAPLIFLAMIFGLAQTEVVERIISLQDGGAFADASALERLNTQQMAIADFLEAPLFGAHYANPAWIDGEYPHNILIETAMALGVIGLILWVIMLFKAASKTLTYTSFMRPMLTLLFVQKFIGSMLSGSIWSSDAVFILLMLVFTIDNNKQSNIENVK
jgi:O-antigen ligase